MRTAADTLTFAALIAALAACEDAPVGAAQAAARERVGELPWR